MAKVVVAPEHRRKAWELLVGAAAPTDISLDWMANGTAERNLPNDGDLCLRDRLDGAAQAIATLGDVPPAPIPMRLICPRCYVLHVDVGEQATTPHRTHACQHCGELWAPAVVPTVGVKFFPGCKNEEAPRG